MTEPDQLKPVEEILSKIGTYYLQPEKEGAPVCKGCFNEHGPCGTPCQFCDRIKTWQKEFAWFLYVQNEFSIYKRIVGSEVKQK